MAETASLLQKYKGAETSDPTAAVELHQKIMQQRVEWSKFVNDSQAAGALSMLKIGAPPLDLKLVFDNTGPRLMKACTQVLGLPDVQPAQWLLTFFYDLLRDDSSCFSIFEDALKEVDLYTALITLLKRRGLDAYTANKASWLLTAIIGHVPTRFTEAQATTVATMLAEQKDGSCTDLGVLDAIGNLLKSDVYRRAVWHVPGVLDCVVRVQPRTATAQHIYRSTFALWLLSFDQQLISEMKTCAVIKKVKEILIFSRSEKVVRLCLTLLRNLLVDKALCEDIVEEGVLEAVQQLEFEKWRDAELYDEIKDMAVKVSQEVSEMSNVERYMRELQTGTLQWGFIHSNKFWAENVKHFEQNDDALKLLTKLLIGCGTDATTLAVACHDIGEFVAYSSIGKKKVANLQVKERIMQLMSSTEPIYREVRREALLCCQKLMLNNWQQAEKATK